MSEIVVSLVHRVSIVLLALMLGAGPPSVCAGWVSTPAARMACCADDGSHRQMAHHGHDADQPLTQADADRCCAASDDDSTTPSPRDAAALMTAPPPGAIPVLLQPPSRAALLRASETIPAAHVPKYLLLSVFLV